MKRQCIPKWEGNNTNKGSYWDYIDLCNQFINPTCRLGFISLGIMSFIFCVKFLLQFVNQKQTLKLISSRDLDYDNIYHVLNITCLQLLNSTSHSPTILALSPHPSEPKTPVSWVSKVLIFSLDKGIRLFTMVLVWHNLDTFGFHHILPTKDNIEQPHVFTTCCFFCFNL